MADPRPLLILRKVQQIEHAFPELALPGEVGDLTLRFEVRGGDAAHLRAAYGATDAQIRALYRPAHQAFVTPMRRDYRSSTRSWTALIPSSHQLADRDIAPFCHQLSAGAGARMRSFRALDFLTDHALVGNSAYTPLRWGPPDQALANIARRQGVWAQDLDAYLALDVAAGGQDQARLVRELNIETTPLEFALLRVILTAGYNNYPTHPEQTVFSQHLSPLNFDALPYPQMIAAGARLEASSWLERFSYDKARSSFVANRGSKARKLSSVDPLELW
jgi:hypothetical protein